MAISLIRTLILYIVVTISIRIMGKRQVGELQNSELVITLMISNLAAIPMQEIGIPLSSGIIPILTLIVCEIFVSGGMMKSNRFRSLICGHPIVVIKDGKLQQKEMKRLRFTIEDLMEALRLKDVFDISDVEFASMETNGKLSVMLKPNRSPPIASDMGIVPMDNGISVVVVSNGEYCPDSIYICGKYDEWVKNYLKKKNIPLEDVFLMTANRGGSCHVIRRDTSERSEKQ